MNEVDKNDDKMPVMVQLHTPTGFVASAKKTFSKLGNLMISGSKYRGKAIDKVKNERKERYDEALPAFHKYQRCEGEVLLE